jgi:hypothetical protein
MTVEVLIMEDQTNRRSALMSLGLVAASAGLMASRPAKAQGSDQPGVALTLPGAADLRALSRSLASAPRRRDYRTVPMVLTDPELWDNEALKILIAYRGGPRQVWDNTEIDGPWLNLMRNAMNAQIWSFKHPNFIAVSATHGPAQLALLDQAMWDKYQLAKLAGPKFVSNTLAQRNAKAEEDKDYESDTGAYSGEDNTIPALMDRGAVFLACHLAIWELTTRLQKQGVNPDKLSHEAMAAELTNHLIPGVVLTPGMVATIPELQQAGFHYIK